MFAHYTINVSAIRQAIERCCRTNAECPACQGKRCLVGFAKIVSEYAGAKRMLSIPNGFNLIPAGDFKHYNADDVAFALAVINYECRNCMDNHEDNCVVNIARSTMEMASFGRRVEFSGNSQTYIMRLSQLNPENGTKVMQAYQALQGN